MRAVVFAGEGEVRLDDVPRPRIERPSDAVVKVSLAAICGSDLHLLDGKTPGMKVGGVIGHEFIGTVEESGGMVAEGTRVLGSFLIACGTCPNCSSGRFNFCSKRRALGLGRLTGDLDGSQAEYVVIPDAAINLKPMEGPYAALDDEHLLFAGDVLTTGFYGANLVGDARSVAVVGAGPIGLFTALALRAGGREVLLLDTDAQRVAFAGDHLGLRAYIATEDPAGVVAEATGGAMAEAAVDAVGTIPAFKSAMRLVRDGGRVVVVGVYGAERYEMPMGMAWIRGLDIVFSGMANIQGHWDEALSAVTDRVLDPTSIITHRMSLDDAVEGYALFAQREAMKVTLKP